ncbi:MAG: hypothetical protein LR017_01850 [Candidatus Pacebacteria bacterium]|nr:hypothetical protein [Candidatus Paceibacterota bacterium]
MRNFILLLGIILVIALILTLTLLYFVRNERTTDDTITIVSSAPMRNVTVGQSIVNGITLALEEADYTAGAYTIAYIAEDGGDAQGSWDSAIEAEIAQHAVADPNVMVYLGTFNSGAAKVSIPITNAGNLAQLSPGNT